METELELFEKKVANVYFWDLIRLNVYRQIMKKSGLHGGAQQAIQNSPPNFREYLLSVLKAIFIRNTFLASRCDILFLGHPRRKKMTDGSWWDIYCDPVIDFLERRHDCLLVEKPYRGKHFAPPKTKNCLYLDFFFLLADILRRFRLLKIKLSGPDRIMLATIQRNVETAFHIQLEDLTTLVERALSYRRHFLFAYELLIKKVRPKIAVVICSYDNKVFIEACRNHEIPVVELQHGTSMGSYHPGYRFDRKDFRRIRFPDHLLVFGDFWKRRIECPISNEKIHAVGYAFFEREALNYRKAERKDDQILFISQGTIGKDLSRLAVDVSRTPGFDHTIVYKLHPEEYMRWRQEYPWLEGSSVHIVQDDGIPLYQLFAESTIQVGVYSTAIYEGLGFGLQTVLIGLPGIEYMDELIENNIVRVANDVDTFKEIVTSDWPKQNSMRPFFEPKALDNSANVLENILATIN
jgi:hypothetical protein